MAELDNFQLSDQTCNVILLPEPIAGPISGKLAFLSNALLRVTVLTDDDALVQDGDSLVSVLRHRTSPTGQSVWVNIFTQSKHERQLNHFRTMVAEADCISVDGTFYGDIDRLSDGKILLADIGQNAHFTMDELLKRTIVTYKLQETMDSSYFKDAEETDTTEPVSTSEAAEREFVHTWHNNIVAVGEELRGIDYNSKVIHSYPQGSGFTPTILR